MAKKNMRDESLKPQVTENEQMGDIVLILDKMELLLQAVSKLDKDGRYETMTASLQVWERLILNTVSTGSL